MGTRTRTGSRPTHAARSREGVRRALNERLALDGAERTLDRELDALALVSDLERRCQEADVESAYSENLGELAAAIVNLRQGFGPAQPVVEPDHEVRSVARLPHRGGPVPPSRSVHLKPEESRRAEVFSSYLARAAERSTDALMAWGAGGPLDGVQPLEREEADAYFQAASAIDRDRLKQAADSLSRKFGWSKAQAMQFLLTREPPQLQPIRISFPTWVAASGQLGTEGDYEFEHVLLRLEVAPWVTPESIWAAMRSILDQLRPPSARPLSLQSLDVLDFVESQRASDGALPGWSELQQRWASHKGAAALSAKNLETIYRRMRRAMAPRYVERWQEQRPKALLADSLRFVQAHRRRLSRRDAAPRRALGRLEAATQKLRQALRRGGAAQVERCSDELIACWVREAENLKRSESKRVPRARGGSK